MRGRVLWFDNRKGYGFIKGYDDRELFCHHTDILKGDTKDGAWHGLYTGSIVEYEVQDYNKEESGRYKAINVVVIPRISEYGKPVVQAAYMHVRGDTPIQAYDMMIGSKIDYGLQYLYSYAGILIATDKTIDDNEYAQIVGAIQQDNIIKPGTIHYTPENVKNDILFL